MARYILDMTKPHKQSMIELVNNDNVATIGTALTVADINFTGERVVAVEEGIAREFAVTLENANYALDKVEVFWNKVAIGDVVTMTADDFQSWYDPDTWADNTSPAAAIAAFKVAALRAGVDADQAMENIVATREHDSTLNVYNLKLTVTSMVFKADVLFRMPKHFSELVTVTELNGFIYSPIAPEAVVE